MKWFDRKFSFEFDLWMYPNLVERLRGTPARVEELTRYVREDIVTKRCHDSWNIQENVGHLMDLEPLWLGRVEDFVHGANVLREADLTNRLTHEAGHNDRSLVELLDGFRAERMRMVAKLDHLEYKLRGAVSLHPRLMQPMRLIDLIYFVAEHDDHHLARISELLRLAKPD